MTLKKRIESESETDIRVNYRWRELALFDAGAPPENENVLAACALRDFDVHKALPPVLDSGGWAVVQTVQRERENRGEEP